MIPSTTVSIGRTRPARFTWFGPDGTTPVSGRTVALGSNDDRIAIVTIDPGNPRRALIHGVNSGNCQIQIGNGNQPIVVDVTVPEVPDLSRFQLDGFDDEF